MALNIRNMTKTRNASMRIRYTSLLKLNTLSVKSFFFVIVPLSGNKGFVE